MKRSKRLLNVPLATLSVLFTSVILFGGTAHAQEAPMPLSEGAQLVQQTNQEVGQKTLALQATTQEIQSLTQKKQSLLTQLEQDKKTIEELKGKLEEKRAAAEAEKKRLADIKNMFVHVNRYADNSSGNTYAPGNCTWYVKSRRPDLPNNLGNADTWFYRAQAQGWNVGYTPKKGAAAQTKAGMHVVYIEAVSLDGSTVTLSEMNYSGLYSMNTRTAPASDFLYIYELE